MKLKPTKHPTNDSLEGQFFHSIVNGQVVWQGVILSTPIPGWYLVQLFEWMMGEPNVRRLVRYSDMVDWLFYGSAAEMTFSYDHGVAREGGLYRKKVKEVE